MTYKKAKLVITQVVSSFRSNILKYTKSTVKKGQSAAAVIQLMIWVSKELHGTQQQENIDVVGQNV